MLIMMAVIMTTMAARMIMMKMIKIIIRYTYSAVVDGSESDDYLKAVEEPLGKDWKAKTHEKRNFCT